MAFGDVGGPVTELVLTCRTPSNGEVDIAKGDAVVLSGPYTVDHAGDAEDPVFGQALAAAAGNDAAIPVKVRGICIFEYTGDPPGPDGETGVTASATAGKVKTPAQGLGHGRVLKTDATAGRVHVLL